MSKLRLSDAKPLKLLPKGRGVWPRATRLQNSVWMELNTTMEAPMAEGLPEEANGIGDFKKKTETESRSSLARVYACSFQDGLFPVKFGC